jgi:hypothetical protein
MRADGTGSRFSKARKKVLYHLADVEEWLAQQSSFSTAAAKRETARDP